MQNYCISQKFDGENLDEFDKMPAIHQSFPFYIPVNAFPMWPTIILSKFPLSNFYTMYGIEVSIHNIIC